VVKNLHGPRRNKNFTPQKALITLQQDVQHVALSTKLPVWVVAAVAVTVVVSVVEIVDLVKCSRLRAQNVVKKQQFLSSQKAIVQFIAVSVSTNVEPKAYLMLHVAIFVAKSLVMKNLLLRLCQQKQKIMAKNSQLRKQFSFKTRLVVNLLANSWFFSGNDLI
jgi:hypothetical protein